MDGSLKGVIVNYSSEVGDEYDVPNSSKTRKVVSVSTAEGYSYSNYSLRSSELDTKEILASESVTIGVEELLTNSPGLQSLIYYFNDIDGLVGVDIVFDDETTASYSFYTYYEGKYD